MEVSLFLNVTNSICKHAKVAMLISIVKPLNIHVHAIQGDVHEHVGGLVGGGMGASKGVEETICYGTCQQSCHGRAIVKEYQ